MASKFIPVALRPSDIQIFANYLGDSFQHTNFFTPSLESYGALRSLGHSRTTFLEGLEGANQNTMSLESQAAEVSKVLDRTFSDIRVSLKIADRDTYGWDYLNFFFIISGYVKSSLLGRHLSRTLPKNFNYLILMPQNGADFHNDCSCFRSEVIKELNGFSIKEWPMNTVESQRNTGIYDCSYRFDEVPKYVDSISSVPTCFGMRMAGCENPLMDDNNIDLQSPYFDVPYSRRRILLSKESCCKLDLLCYGNLIEKAVREITSNSFINFSQNTLARLRERAIFQANLYNSLKSSLNLRCISKLLVSNHDGGIQGPLLSWGLSRGLEVSMIPHSHVDNIPRRYHGIVFKSVLPRAKALTHYFDYSPGAAAIERFLRKDLDLRSTLRPLNKTRTIKILLVHNSLDDYVYSPSVRFSDYSNALNILENIDRVFHVAHRWKPTSRAHYLFRGSGLVFESLLESLKWADIVVGVGQPTSVLFDGVQLQKPTVLLSNHDLGPVSLSLVPEETTVISLGSLTASADYLASLLRESFPSDTL